MEYYPEIKRNEFESVLVMWMNPEPVMQSERAKCKSEREKQISYIRTHLWNLEK